jgi:hypothetical protein
MIERSLSSSRWCDGLLAWFNEVEVFLHSCHQWDDTSGKNNGHFAPFNWQAS